MECLFVAPRVPPYAYIHAIPFAVVERCSFGVRVLSQFRIGIAQLLYELSVGHVDGRIEAYSYRRKRRIARATAFAPCFYALGI